MRIFTRLRSKKACLNTRTATIVAFHSILISILLGSCSKRENLSANVCNPNFKISNPAFSTLDTTANLTTDFLINQGTFNHSPGRNLCTVLGQYKYSPTTWTHINDLGVFEKARIWLAFRAICNKTSKVAKYNNTNLYFDAFNNNASSLYLNWQTSYDEFIASGWTESELLTTETNALAYFKSRYPKIEFIECENELTPDAQMAGYYFLYKFINKMVNSVNAMNLPGPKLKIGGPTTSSPTQYYIQKFLDRYVEDTSSSKKLDFISYHQYLFNNTKDNPSQVSTERATVNSWLSARNLPSLPIYISETGIFQQDVSSLAGVPTVYHIQAAGIATMHYYYENQAGMTPFLWTIIHPNDRKNLFVDSIGGIPRPFYNMAKMMMMLPNTRYSSGTALTTNGLGIGSLAGGSATQVALMTWNYQWINTQTYNVSMLLKNLPVAFKTKNVRVERYLIDSNYDSGELLKVEDHIYGPFTYGQYLYNLPLNPNALGLVVLTAQ
jgi:hypothetical protein